VSTEETSSRRQTAAARIAERRDRKSRGNTAETGGSADPSAQVVPEGLPWIMRKTGLYEWQDGSGGRNPRSAGFVGAGNGGACSRRKEGGGRTEKKKYLRDTVTRWRDTTGRALRVQNNNIRTEYGRTTTLKTVTRWRSCARRVPLSHDRTRTARGGC